MQNLIHQLFVQIHARILPYFNQWTHLFAGMMVRLLEGASQV